VYPFKGLVSGSTHVDTSGNIPLHPLQGNMVAGKPDHTFNDPCGNVSKMIFWGWLYPDWEFPDTSISHQRAECWYHENLAIMIGRQMWRNCVKLAAICQELYQPKQGAGKMKSDFMAGVCSIVTVNFEIVSGEKGKSWNWCLGLSWLCWYGSCAALRVFLRPAHRQRMTEACSTKFFNLFRKRLISSKVTPTKST
jgi:hypothetical protein